MDQLVFFFALSSLWHDRQLINRLSRAKKYWPGFLQQSYTYIVISSSETLVPAFTNQCEMQTGTID